MTIEEALDTGTELLKEAFGFRGIEYASTFFCRPENQATQYLLNGGRDIAGFREQQLREYGKYVGALLTARLHLREQ